jgi:CRP-like cAMP-binding protein
VSNDLWIEGPDDIANARMPKRRRNGEHSADLARHIGCPLWWFMAVFPAVRSKKELAVALYIYRLRAVRHSRAVAISNTGLLAELGISRYTKYRALKRLADAGLISIRRSGKNSLTVTIRGRHREGERKA